MRQVIIEFEPLPKTSFLRSITPINEEETQLAVLDEVKQFCEISCELCLGHCPMWFDSDKCLLLATQHEKCQHRERRLRLTFQSPTVEII